MRLRVRVPTLLWAPLLQAACVSLLRETEGRLGVRSCDRRRSMEPCVRWGACAAQCPDPCACALTLTRTHCVCVCAQELLAVQLVHEFSEIFKDAGLPLRLRHYDVLVTSNRWGIWRGCC